MKSDDRKTDALQWISRDDFKIRIKRGADTSSVWISSSGVNLCIPLMMHDFLEHCNEFLSLNIGIDSSWNSHKGFQVKSDDVEIFLDETIKFINEWDIEPSENAKKISEEEWFSNE